MAAVLAVVPGTGFAAEVPEYLPPPTGPYQSSVVINTVERNSDHQTQVYRFPPADLTFPDEPAPIRGGGPAAPGFADYGSRPPIEDAPPPLTTRQPQTAPEGSANANAWPGSGSGGLPANPWAPDNMTGPAPASQGAWGGTYTYPQYPYGYYNGYTTYPYQVAPSPWAVNPPPMPPGR